MQSDNQLVAGHWWNVSDYGKRVLSVEEGLAKTLGIKLGDTLHYMIGGEEFTAKVTSLRKVEWDSMRANFFVMAPPGALDGYPASYITSLYVPQNKPELMNKLVKAFPNVTVIDVAAIMAQVRLIMERVSLAVEYVFLFTVMAGLLVLYAAIQATLDERIRESAILRTLGARRGQLLTGLFSEFAVLGLLAGLVASSAATLLGYLLATQVFHLPFALNPWIWLTGIVGGTLGVGLAGLFGTRFILQRPPLEVLRNSY
jgi:putative ABC transport system permease protein